MGNIDSKQQQSRSSSFDAPFNNNNSPRLVASPATPTTSPRLKGPLRFIVEERFNTLVVADDAASRNRSTSIEQEVFMENQVAGGWS